MTRHERQAFMTRHIDFDGLSSSPALPSPRFKTPRSPPEPHFWAPNAPWGRWEITHIFIIFADFRAAFEDQKSPRDRRGRLFRFKNRAPTLSGVF
jgi:hypothetical protein